MLFGGHAGQRLEPVGKVGGAVLQRPILHRCGHRIGYGAVERLVFIDGPAQGGIHLGWQLGLHHAVVKDQASEIIRYRFHRFFSFFLFHPKRGSGVQGGDAVASIQTIKNLQKKKASRNESKTPLPLCGLLYSHRKRLSSPFFIFSKGIDKIPALWYNPRVMEQGRSSPSGEEALFSFFWLPPRGKKNEIRLRFFAAKPWKTGSMCGIISQLKRKVGEI